MSVNNTTILGKIYLNGSNDYQQRVPNPTQSTVAETMEFLTQPMNGRYYNEFISNLVNLIGMQVVHSRQWANPLAVFKKDRHIYGSTVQESAFKWIKAHAYDDSDLSLLKMNRPEMSVWYHSLNRQDRYDISINRDELLNAVRDEYGLNKLVDAALTVPMNSDNYDEFLIMLNLIAEYEARWGFYKVKLSPVTGDGTGKAFLTQLRKFANVLPFPSTQYNASDIDIPVFAQKSEMVLLIEATTQAAVDVNTIASVFNLDKADIQYRTVIVPYIPVSGAFALLTTEDFFQCYDKVYETTSFYNPQTLTENYFLHHWGTYSVSPFVPAILFGDFGEGTALTTVTQTVTGLNLVASSSTIQRGGTVVLTPTLAGTLSSAEGNVEIAPDSCTWDVSASRTIEGDDSTSVTTVIPLNSRTYVDRLGVLHCQRTGLQDGDVITVKATNTYIDPDSATTTAKTATATVTVSGVWDGATTLADQTEEQAAKEPYTK